MGETKADLTPQSLLSVAQFTLELFRPGHPLSVTNLSEVLSELKAISRRRCRRLTGHPLPDDVHKALIPSTAVQNLDVSDTSRCLVVGRTAAITLGVPLGGSCWVVASRCKCCPVNTNGCLSECMPKESGKWYVLQVVSNRGLSGSFHYLNETTFYNLVNSLAPDCTDLEEKGMNITVKNCEEVRWMCGENRMRFLPKIATKAVVSWVREYFEVTENLIASCLTNYFEKPRHFHTGDILKISVKKYAPESVFLPGNHIIQNLYFIVKQLDGPAYGELDGADKNIGYIVMKNETTLIQSSNSQSLIPRSTFSSGNNARDVSSENFSSLLQNQCPGALSKLHRAIVAAIRPFLRSNKPALKPAFLLIGPTGSGKYTLVSSIAAYLGLHLWHIDCSEMHGLTSGLTEGKLRAVFAKAVQCAPCIFMLQNIEILSKDKDGHEDLRTIAEFQERLSDFMDSEFPVIVMATSTASSNLSGSLARSFLQEFTIPPFDEDERHDHLLWILRHYSLNATDECIRKVALRCSGFLAADLDALVVQAYRNNFIQNKQKQHSPRGNILSFQDFEEALDKMQSAYAGAIGAPKIPTVSWSDVGGLGKLKEEILRTVMMPLQHPELVAAGLRRSGILLYGPPGTGKTLIAKAVATECSLNFLSVKGPELLNMYVGQSEENVREVFERARAASPCIVFFDELDSLAPNRGRSGDSGGVMDRVVSQLLAEMDGLQKSTHLFVIGATNRPDLIDPALLRPGRFDKLLYVGPCEDREGQLSVLIALTRRFKLKPDVNLHELVTLLPRQVTGADLYAACSTAWMASVRRAVHSAQTGGGKVDSSVEVAQDDFKEAISKMAPSVSAEDMAYYQSLSRQLSAPK